jgi:hypothetical protein
MVVYVDGPIANVVISDRVIQADTPFTVSHVTGGTVVKGVGVFTDGVCTTSFRDDKAQRDSVRKYTHETTITALHIEGNVFVRGYISRIRKVRITGPGSFTAVPGTTSLKFTGYVHGTGSICLDDTIVERLDVTVWGSGSITGCTATERFVAMVIEAGRITGFASEGVNPETIIAEGFSGTIDIECSKD